MKTCEDPTIVLVATKMDTGIPCFEEEKTKAILGSTKDYLNTLCKKTQHVNLFNHMIQTSASNVQELMYDETLMQDERKMKMNISKMSPHQLANLLKSLAIKKKKERGFFVPTSWESFSKLTSAIYI